MTYSVRTTVREHSECKDVPFVWFYSTERSQRRPYADLIKDYDPAEDDIGYAEGYVEELFTEGEAKQLKDYLDLVHGDEGTTTTEEMRLPLQNKSMGFRGFPVGGGDDFYMVHKEADYSLPFEVMGYFNLVGRELIHSSDVYHHRLWILSPNGEFRKQPADALSAARSAG
jgi:hypothetical protein